MEYGACDGMQGSVGEFGNVGKVGLLKIVIVK